MPQRRIATQFIFSRFASPVVPYNLAKTWLAKTWHALTRLAFIGLVLTRLALAGLLLSPAVVLAGGPKHVAGVSFFNPSVLGQPIHWSGGKVNYYVDQGPLNSGITNQQAAAMVDAAAALWTAIPPRRHTHQQRRAQRGHKRLQHRARGTNFRSINKITQVGQIAAPADVTPSATDYPLGVIYDADGSVIDTIFGAGASDPTSCQDNGVWDWMDNVNADATIAHGIILLNGLCATTPSLVEMMNYELERAFGRILNLDYSQVNPRRSRTRRPVERRAGRSMQPLSGICRQRRHCIPNPGACATTISPPSTAFTRSPPKTRQLPRKQLTAANTVSIQGAITFSTGLGMQGVNVVARPLDASGNPSISTQSASYPGIFQR